MKKAVLFLMIFALAGAAFGQTVVGSKHDLRATGGGTPTGTGLTEVCVVCHTPHQTTAAGGQDPLWNHTRSSTASYGVYASNTMNLPAPTDVGGAAYGSMSTTNLCLSCHDGTVSVLSMLNPPNSGTPTVAALANRITAAGFIDPASTAFVGTSLTDDHPVNFTYDTARATADGGLKDPAVTPAVSALLSGGTVQCTSCHDVHNGSAANAPFLVMSNAASALCLTCHNK